MENPFSVIYNFVSSSYIFREIFSLLWSIAPLLLPALFVLVGTRLWLNYVRLAYIQKTGTVLLEIRLPIEISKSPKAMEMFFGALYQKGSVTILETFFDGKTRPWFSLELVSLGGAVKYFISTQPKYRTIIETQLYAHFPGIEIYEVPDYTTSTEYSDRISMWGTYFILTKPDAYPIRTYIDYGLDKDPKEEFKIDPIVPVLEYLGSMKRGQQVWIQILIQAHRKEGFSDARVRAKPDWKTEAQNEIKMIKEKTVVIDEETKKPMFSNMTEGQREAIQSIERSLDKYPFEVAIRGIYLTEADVFDPAGITGLIGSVSQYSSNGELNGFKLGWFTDFDYPWQDFKRIRRTSAEKKMLKAYKLRSFFQPPFKHFKQKPIILTTEELATIFHFPGSVASTPSFQRIVSRKAEAPSNLPI